MSRSYRRPWSTLCGNGSAKKDKQLAARSMRRTQNRWLDSCKDFEASGLVPHRLECANNNVWDWARDGKQCYSGLETWTRHWNRYCRLQQGLYYEHEMYRIRKYGVHHSRAHLAGQMVWPPPEYLKMLRK